MNKWIYIYIYIQLYIILCLAAKRGALGRGGQTRWELGPREEAHERGREKRSKDGPGLCF